MEVAPQAKGKKIITKKEDSDFEMDDDPIPKKVAPKPKKRVISKKGSGSDVEVFDQPAQKGKGKEKEQPSKKRKRYERPAQMSHDLPLIHDISFTALRDREAEAMMSP